MRYPRHITWHRSLSGASTIAELFSAKTFKKIRRGLTLLESQGFRLEVEAVDDALLIQFEQLYRANIEKKTSPRIYPVRERILERQATGKHYAMLTLRHSEHFLGGLIFSMSAGVIRTAYKVFPAKLEQCPLPISPTFLAEARLFDYGLAQGFDLIIHGKDHNCYGQYSAIGLAQFKTQLGCVPYVSKSTDFVDIDDSLFVLPEDTLVFLGDELDAPVTQALLFTHLSQEEATLRYPLICSHPQYQVQIHRFPALMTS